MSSTTQRKSKMVWIPFTIACVVGYMYISLFATKAAYNAADGVWGNEDESRRLFALVLGFSWPLTVPFAIVFGIGHTVISNLWKGD